MHAAARLALVFALGLAGLAQAGENLPPLRVDPALLGGAIKPIQPRPAEPSAPAVRSLPPTEAPPAAATSPERTRAAAPSPAPEQATPVAAEKVERKAAVAEKPAMAKESTEARAAAAEPPAAQPPQVAEQPALPALYSAHAEAGLVPALKPAGQLAPLPTDKNTPLPAFIAASRIDGRNDNEVVAQGEAELRKATTNLTAERLTYWKIEDELEAVGNVRYNKEAEYIAGPKLRLNLTESTGFFEQPEYSITRPAKVQKQFYSPALGAAAIPTKKAPSFLPRERTQKPTMTVIAGEIVAEEGQRLTTGSGKADLLEFQGENRMRLTNATYTTCTADSPDWYAKVAELNLDYDREVGEGRDAKVVFKDVTLFYTPWLSFSLNNKRKSGFLAPTFGTSSKSGIEFSLPYYWDIAPNMDMTIAPRLMSKRGLQINSEFRYLNHGYRGLARVEWLPQDRLADRNRYGYSLLHHHSDLGYGFSGLLNINGVSDGTYLRDLSTRITQASQGNLLRQGVLSYSGGWWSAAANMQVYQTLQDPALPPVVKPYERVPQFTLTASRPEFLGGTAFAFNGEYVLFDHPTLDTGRRMTLYPQLSLPLQAPAWHITPKLGLHFTRYDINRRSSMGPDTIVRNLPILSVDAGLAFERKFDWFGKSLAQTLEPRLYYLLVPQRTQNQIPVFDTGLSDFNFATIFSDNTYSGYDRIADANQLTAALTSRLIDPQTGEEYVRGMVGQRYYFARQHVTLPGEPARPGGTSDFLAALSGRLLPNTYGDTAWQYDPRDGETERFNVGVRWQPDIAKVLNASYRYTRDHSGITGGNAGIRQVDFSGQWPLGRGWYGVGRFNYSLRESKIIETIAGLEYNGGCWVGRAVLQRYATATGDTNTAFFLQLELNEFSNIGSNPLQMLARRIPGYGRINQLASDPVFGYE
jgi:LPS-assembly protein